MKNAKITSMKIYSFLIPFVLGAFLTVFVYQAVTIYQLRSTVAEDHATIASVVSFLNTQIQAAQQVPQPAKASSVLENSSTISASSSKK
jgi:hypothetical protein